MKHCDLDITRLVDLNYASVYRYAFRLSGSAADAEDLVQEAFLAVQAKGGQIREADSARSWLYAVVRNAYLKQLRSPGRRRGRSIELTSEPLAPPGPWEWQHDFDAEALQAALLDLPEEYRTPIVLYYFSDCSYREIADQLQVPMGTVMSRLSRAKSALRDRLSTEVPGALVPASQGTPP